MKPVYHTSVEWIGRIPTLFLHTKRCNTCQQDLPFEAFTTDSAQKDGLQGRCTQCRRNQWANRPLEEKEQQQTRRKELENQRREEIRAYDRKRHNTDEHRAKRRGRNAEKREQELQKGMATGELHQLSLDLPEPITEKQCPHCTEIKPIQEFTRSSRRKDGYASWCKTCCANYHHNRLDARRAHERSRGEEFAKKKLIFSAQYYAKRRELTTDPLDYEAVLDQHGFWCHVCGQKIRSDQNLEFDHVIPLHPRWGEPQGTHTFENIRPAHDICNRRKSNKPLEKLTPFDRRGPDPREQVS